MRCNAIGRPPGSQIAALILMFSSCAFARAPRRMRLVFQVETHRLFPPPGTLMVPVGVTVAQLGIEHLSLFGSIVRAGSMASPRWDGGRRACRARAWRSKHSAQLMYKI